MRDITELWIITQEGLCIFHYATEETFDPNLFGGFITAINMFSKQLTKDNVQSLSLGHNRISILYDSSESLFFIGRAKNSINEKVIHKILEQLKAKFFEKYHHNISKWWEGNLDVFSGYKDEIAEIFKDKTEIMQNMW